MPDPIDNTGTDGSGEGAPSEEIFTEGEPQPQGGKPEGGEGGEGGGKPELTAEAIAEAIKKSGLGAPAAAVAGPPPTQEEFDKLFNVWQPNEDLIKTMLAGGPEAVKAMLALRDGVSKQAVTMASYLVQQLKEELLGQITPMNNYYQEQQVQQLFGEFYKENPGLKPYDSLVRAVVDQMRASNVKLGSKEAAFKELANRVRTVMKSLPGSDGNALLSGEATAQPGRMPTLSSGGQGGGGRGSQSGGKKSPGHAVFG